MKPTSLSSKSLWTVHQVPRALAPTITRKPLHWALALTISQVSQKQPPGPRPDDYLKNRLHRVHNALVIDTIIDLTHYFCYPVHIWCIELSVT